MLKSSYAELVDDLNFLVYQKASEKLFPGAARKRKLTDNHAVQISVLSIKLFHTSILVVDFSITDKHPLPHIIAEALSLEIPASGLRIEAHHCQESDLWVEYAVLDILLSPFRDFFNHERSNFIQKILETVIIAFELIQFGTHSLHDTGPAGLLGLLEVDRPGYELPNR